MILSEIRDYYKNEIEKHDLTINASLSDFSYITYALQLSWFNKFDIELLIDDNKEYQEIYKKEKWFRDILQCKNVEQLMQFTCNRNFIDSRYDKIRLMEAELQVYSTLGDIGKAFELGLKISKEVKLTDDYRYMDFMKNIVNQIYIWGFTLNKMDDLLTFNEFHKKSLDNSNIRKTSLYYENHFRILARLHRFNELLRAYNTVVATVDLETLNLKAQMSIYYSKATAEYYLGKYIDSLWSFEKAYEISKKMHSLQNGIQALTSLIDVAMMANLPTNSGRMIRYKEKLLAMLKYASSEFPTVIAAYSRLSAFEYNNGNYSDASVYLENGFKIYNENKDEHQLFYLIMNMVKYTPNLPGTNKYIMDYLIEYNFDFPQGPLKDSYIKLLNKVVEHFILTGDLENLDKTMKKLRNV